MIQHCLGWQWVSGYESKFLQQGPRQTGFNIYAPVMYRVGSRSLEMIKDFSSNIYLAREQGYRVWLTVQQFGTKPRLEGNIIEEIINKALRYGVDGINIDFEGMGESNRDKFTSFISELYRQASQHKLVLSVDVVRPAVSMYSMCYDRRTLAQVCDYLILMAYDQHWATSPQEGSVAELPWTEDSIIKLLQDEGVPAERLILAIPFYSRNWKIQVMPYRNMVLLTVAVNLRRGPSTQHSIIYTGSKDEGFKCLGQVDGEPVSGNTTWYQVEYSGATAYVSAAYSTRLSEGETRRVSSTAIGLQDGLDILTNYNTQNRTSCFGDNQMFNVDIAYDQKAQQVLVTYDDNEGNHHKIWLEDFKSLEKRRALAEKHKLAGLAAWSLEWLDDGQQAWRKLLGDSR